MEFFEEYDGDVEGIRMNGIGIQPPRLIDTSTAESTTLLESEGDDDNSAWKEILIA